jgi:DNA-binding phage protein
MTLRPRHKTIPDKAHPFVQDIFKEMIRQNMTYDELSERSGVSKKILERWRLATEPQLTTLHLVLKALGLKLQVVKENE